MYTDVPATVGVEIERPALQGVVKASFHVTGMSCASCVNKVERHLKKKNGTYTVCAQCSGPAHMHWGSRIYYTHMCGDVY